MSRILFAWELGANLGHLTRIAPIAEKLRARGHQVLFAVRDVKSGARVLGAKGFAFTQAPFCHRRPGPAQAPGNHAEMLALEGYADAASLWGMVRGWIALMQLFRAEVVLADHSPGALIAGRILGLPQAQLGHGFEIPPQVTPLPSIRPWENLPPERLQRSEQRLLESINGAVRSFRGRELERLADLFQTEARILATFPELDPFGPRPHERYIGSIYEARSGAEFNWPGSERPRIYAYLRPRLRAVGNILRALKAANATTICFIPELGQESVRELASDKLRITTRPLQLDSALRQADLAILYGGHGVMSASLAMGVPALVARQNVEQYLHVKKVEALGAGALLGKDTSTAAISAQLGQTLTDGALKAGAQAFAARHAEFDPAGAIDEAVRIIDALAAGKRDERHATTETPQSDGVTPGPSFPGEDPSPVRHEAGEVTGRRAQRKGAAR